MADYLNPAAATLLAALAILAGSAMADPIYRMNRWSSLPQLVVAARTAKRLDRFVPILRNDGRTEIALKDVPLKTFLIAFDAVSPVVRLKLRRHLPDHTEQRRLHADALILDHITNFVLVRHDTHRFTVELLTRDTHVR
jgi:hypothetical protein